MLLRLSIVLILIVSAFNAEAQSGCYFPNGTEITDQGYKRCRLDTADSMCCNIGQGVPDQCLPNGLCRNRCDINGTGCSGNSPTYWRETCTDSTWSSPYCLKNVCTDSSVPGATASDNVVMTQCQQDKKWCCGSMSSDACCNDDRRILIADVLGESTFSSMTSTSVPTSTSTQSDRTQIQSSSEPASEHTSTSRPSSDDSNNQRIGLGVGLGLGIPLVVGAILAGVLVVRRRRVQPTGSLMETQQLPVARDKLPGPFELTGSQPIRGELPADNPRHELDDSSTSRHMLVSS